MNVREGTRRLALLFGCCGAIVGALLGYSAYRNAVSSFDPDAFMASQQAHGANQFGDLPVEEPAASTAQNSPPAEWVPPELRDAPPAKWVPPLKDDKVVEVPGVGKVSFPARMSDDAIAAKIKAMGAKPLSVKNYIVPLLSPALGFLLCWGAVRMLAWVAIGFWAP
jgi:hypothetical protein